MVRITKVKMQSGVEKVKLEIPYHPNLLKRARELGGEQRLRN